MPLWRRLGPRVSDGRDVEQLERNLVELGHDPQGMTVDETFDADTAAAVRSWQEALGLPETGAIEPGDAVFLRPEADRPARDDGRGAGPAGAAVLEVTATSPVVEIDLDARSQELARVGAKVRVELPSGRSVTGIIASVGQVAETSTTPTGETGDPTVSVVVRLADPGSATGSTARRSPWRSSATAPETCSRCPSRPCWRSAAAGTRSRSSARAASGRSPRSRPARSPTATSR